MEILVYVLIALAGVMAIYALVKAGLFKKKKSTKNKDSAKPESKPEQDKNPTEPDTGFKITKKERLAKINKKALKTDSRTAKVEQVFAKEKEPDIPESPVIEINQKLSKDDEDLVMAIEQIDTEERKVVSLGELKKQADAKKQAEIAEERLLKEGIKTIDGTEKELKRTSSGRAGEVTGEYTGISIGKKRSVDSLDKTQQTTLDNTSDKENDDLDFSSLFDSPSPFMDPDFNPFRNRSRFFRPEPEPEPVKPKKFDIGDAVQAEAILNPKFKNPNKNPKKTDN